MSRECEVSLNNIDCEAPPGSYGSIRTTCFRCGNPACKGCSTKVRYLGRQRRICADCIEDHRDELEVPASEMLRLGLDIYRSNTGAADLIPNKITRRGWIGQTTETEGALVRHAVMWEHVNGQTTGKHSEEAQS
jgi:hypothetical protein